MWALVLLVTGCKVYGLKEKRLTCAEDFHPWAGGLAGHMDSGPGDGSFDYDPIDPIIERIAGTYDLKTGDFSYFQEYVSDAWRDYDDIVGFGTVWNDGDLDIEYTLTATLDNDDTIDVSIREQRFGCEHAKRTEQDDGEVDEVVGDYTDGGFEYERTFARYGAEVVSSGRIESDLSFEETLSFRDGPVRLEWDDEGDGEGFFRRDFLEVVGTVLEGFWERDLFGDVLAVYDVTPPGGALQRWDYTLDEDGDGDGTLVTGATTCGIRFNDGTCTFRDCALSGPCTPPLELPRL